MAKPDTGHGDSPAVLSERSLDPFLGVSPRNDRSEEPRRAELPVLRRADTTDGRHSMRWRIKQPDAATVPDGPTGRSSAAPLCEGARPPRRHHRNRNAQTLD